MLSKRAKWVLAMAMGLLVAGGLGAYRLMTSFDRSLVRYAELCEGEQLGWYNLVNEADPGALRESLYLAHYETQSRVPAKAARDWVCNSTDGKTVPAIRCGGMLYVIVHKWKNFAAGVCVPVDTQAAPMIQKGLQYFPIAGSRWQYWKADMEE